MKSFVAGLVMLASGVVRERAAVFDPAAVGRDGSASRQGDRVASMEFDGMSDTGGASFGAAADGESVSDGAPPRALEATPEPGSWEVACQRKSGSVLVFDRRSLRELGDALLVRWAAPSESSEAPRVDEQIFTAVVSCREKTIEASWPGKRSETRPGTCGRRLVDAVCAAAPTPAPRAHGRRAVLK
jgi:hypothetical protein